MTRLVSTVLLVASAVAGNPLRGSAAPATGIKIPLDYKAYDSWNAIRGTKLSADGTWVAYALVPQDGDPTLVIRNLTSGAELRETRGLAPQFTADSKFVVYAIRASNEALHAAERAHKKPDEQPKNGLGILELGTGKLTTFERVKSVEVAPDPGSDTIAVQFEAPAPSPKPSVAAIATPKPEASAAPGPKPSPSASPDDLHKIEAGNELRILELANGLHATSLAGVSAYAIAHDGAFVAYAVEKADKTDAVFVRAAGAGAETSLLAGEGHYDNLTFAPKTQLLAFESDVASFAQKAPAYVLYQVDLRASGPAPAAVALAGPTSPGMPAGWAPNTNGTLAYTKDGKRLFLGTAPAPTPAPSGTPEPMKVSIWSWRDGDLQSYQRKHADDERKRTYDAVVHEDGARFVQLGAPSLREIEWNQNPDYALGSDDVVNRKAFSWTGSDQADEYAVSLRDGSRESLRRKAYDGSFLSPDGRFIAYYDRVKRDWYALRTSDAARVSLTERLPGPFYDEQDDHPGEPPPYEFGGFAEGSRYILIRDRYDVWAVDPVAGTARNLTGGLGRKLHLRFAPLQLDPQRDSFALDQPLVLSAFDDVSKDSGLYVDAFTGPGAFAPRKIVMLPKALGMPLKARDAGRIVMTEQRIDEVQNLWSAPELGAPLVKISDANPQKAKYVWATAQLVNYKSTWGAPLQGILMLPENFDRTKKYPMLVWFYERFSDDLHRMPFTTPGPGTSPNLLRYVSNGYVVLIPDVAYLPGHPGKSALGCVLPAIDAVVRRGYVDNARVGVAGHSWGAYQIAYMITRTNRFRAAEAGAAVDDMISAYGGIREGEGYVREFQYETGQSRIGATPWDRLDLYVENSPLFGIKNVHTPYLTIANDADDAVPWQQGIEFNTALRRLGKEAYMFEFDGELHNLRGREAQKYWTVHLDEFFDHYLKGAPEPDWMRSGVDFLHRGERDMRPIYGTPTPEPAPSPAAAASAKPGT
jgi:dipeptidyl aminopeptidase/acylaminoacyl peptidase